METQTKKFLSFIILPLCIIALLAVLVWPQTNPEPVMRVHFYSVGQGDASFIETYEGNQVLIDGGPNSSVLEKLGADMPFWDRTIEMVILTHAHADHVNGLVDVLKRYKVKKIMLPNTEYKSNPYDEFLNLLKKENAEIIFAKQGQRVYLDRSTVFDVYFPLTDDVAKPKQSDDVNDTSIVGKLSFGKNKILFMGDAGTEIEFLLLPHFNLDADVLKVGHHGSRHSTSKELLDEVTPYASVVEVGENPYGHPTSEVINLLQEINSQIYRTDRDGDIEFVADGINLFRK